VSTFVSCPICQTATIGHGRRSLCLRCAENATTLELGPDDLPCGARRSDLADLDELRLIEAAWNTLPESVRAEALARVLPPHPEIGAAIAALPIVPAPEGWQGKVWARINAKESK